MCDICLLADTVCLRAEEEFLIWLGSVGVHELGHLYMYIYIHKFVFVCLISRDIDRTERGVSEGSVFFQRGIPLVPTALTDY